MVHPDLTDSWTVEGTPPNKVNDNTAYEVRSFDWLPETEDLVLAGTWPAAAKDSDLLTSMAYVEEIHDKLLETYEFAGKLRGRFSRMGMDVQERTINYEAEADERGTMLDKSAVRETWAEAKDDVELDDDLPSLDAEYLDEHGATEPLDADGSAGEAAATDGGNAE
jgi:hypothetical protein